MPQVIHPHQMLNASPTACHSERFLNPINPLATVFNDEVCLTNCPHLPQPLKETILNWDGPVGLGLTTENPHLFLDEVYIGPPQGEQLRIAGAPTKIETDLDGPPNMVIGMFHNFGNIF